MRISRRDLLRHSAIGAAVTAAVASPAERRLRAAAGARLGEGSPLRFPVRLNRNCNAYGPSERAVAAIVDAAGAANDDPDDQLELLRERIAGTHGVSPGHVVVESGSGAILRLAVDAFAGPGRTVITASPTFGLIGEHARRAGCQVVAIPLRPDGSHDLEAMLARARAAPSVVYICNPNNPTGTLTRRPDLETFLRTLPSSAHVVIDEAYHHYVDDASDYRSFIDSRVEDARIIVTRTFSKIHGLSGMRIGFAITSPETAAQLTADRPPVAVSVIAARAAVAALGDSEYVQASRTRNADDRQEFFNQANARMLRCLDSQANFVMLDTSGVAHPVAPHFAANRIVLPPPFSPLEQYVRVSIGTPAAMQEFWRVWDLMPGMQHH
jgi:histidinol-phosphate aminotransferase